MHISPSSNVLIKQAMYTSYPSHIRINTMNGISLLSYKDRKSGILQHELISIERPRTRPRAICIRLPTTLVPSLFQRTITKLNIHPRCNPTPLPPSAKFSIPRTDQTSKKTPTDMYVHPLSVNTTKSLFEFNQVDCGGYVYAYGDGCGAAYPP
jgi:hypothetical protein